MLASVLCASDGPFDPSAMYSLDVICSVGSHAYSMNPIQRAKEMQMNGCLHLHNLKILTRWAGGAAMRTNNAKMLICLTQQILTHPVQGRHVSETRQATTVWCGRSSRQPIVFTLVDVREDREDCGLPGCSQASANAGMPLPNWRQVVQVTMVVRPEHSKA